MKIGRLTMWKWISKGLKESCVIYLKKIKGIDIWNISDT